ncbi:MAG: ParB/RepB/Spo0J family partition protein, partial [Polyangiales bacterium]
MKPRLGRGLDVLIPKGASQHTAAPALHFEAAIEELKPRQDQPRRDFDPEALASLAQSLREVGILEPILVRPHAQQGYEIIAGERRWRAAQKAGLKRVPVWVHHLSDDKAFAAALIENLQREDLNPVECAQAYKRLLQPGGHSQESLARLIGRDRS